MLGMAHQRGHTLDLQFLGLDELDLSDLEAIFTEEVVWNVIKEIPPDRAPGPDGFIGIFHHKAWSIIKPCSNYMLVMAGDSAS